MTDYRVGVQIDPSQSTAGRTVVENNLRAIETAAEKVQVAVDRATDFSGAKIGSTSYHGLVDAAGAATRATEQLATAQKASTSATRTQADATRSGTSALSDMAEAIAEVNRADAAMATALAKAAAAVKTEGTAAKAAAGDLKGLEAAEKAHTSAANAAVKATGGAGGGLSDVGKTAKLTGEQLKNLSFQLNDVVTGLASGQKPMQILAQQGGQVFQALQQGPGGVGGSLKGLLGLLNPVTIGIGLMAGAAAGLAVASYSASDATDKMTQATYGLGRGTGMTASQLQDLARSAADAAGISVGSAEKLEQTYIRMGTTNSTVLRGLIDLTDDYAATTGQKAADAATELGKAFEDPIAGAKLLDERIGGLDARTRDLIETLVKKGDKDGAQIILMKLLADRTRGAADEVSGLARAYRDATTWASNFFRAIGQATNAAFSQTPGAGYADRPPASFSPAMQGRGQSVPDGTPSASQARADAALAAQRKKQKDDDARSSLAEADALDKLNPKQKRINDLKAEEDTIRQGIKAHRISPAEGNAAIAAGEKEIAQLDGSAAAARHAASEAAKLERQKEAAAKAAARHAEQLAREAEAQEAETAATLRAANAYGTSASAGLRAEAAAQSVGKAIKGKADQDAAEQRQLDSNAAKAALNASKTLDGLIENTKAQHALNDEVEKGHLTAQQAAVALSQGTALRELEAQADAASGDAKALLIKRIGELRTVQGLANKETERAAQLAVMAAADDGEEAAGLEKKLALMKATDREAAIAMARLQAEQAVRNRLGEKGLDSDEGRDQVRSAVNTATDKADAGIIKGGAIDGVDAGLTRSKFAQQAALKALKKEQDDRLKIVKDALAAGVIDERGAAARTVEIHKDLAAKIKEIDQARYDVALTAASDTFGSLADAAKSFAGEQSGIYKGMFAISKAFAIADSILKITQGVANAMSLPFPANLAAAATVAALGAGIVADVTAVAANFSKGGPVSGPGTSTSDSILANISNGEYVVNARATSENRPMLDAMNAGLRPSLAGPGTMSANDNRSPGPMRVTIINQHGGVDHQVRQISETEVEVIAKRVVDRHAGSAVARDLGNPNSRASKGIQRTTTARPRRSGG